METDDGRTVPIGDLCLGIFDGPHATPKKTTEGPVFLGISSLNQGRIDLSVSQHLSEEDFVRWTRRVTPQPNDIVFSYETRIGEVAIIPEGLNCCLGRRMALMRPDPNKVDPRFLVYAYLGPEFQETLRARTVHGSTVDRLLLTEFASFPIRIPPLWLQRRISALLGAFDEKFELNRRANGTLEGMVDLVFKSWILDRFNRGPDEWLVAAAGDGATVVGGSTPRTSEPSYWSGSIPFATPRDLAKLTAPVLLRTQRSITPLGLSQIASGLLPEGTVLMSSRAPIGYLAIASAATAINQGIIAMVPDRGIPGSYLLSWIRANMNAIIANANGSTFSEISVASFRRLPMVRPPATVLQALDHLIAPMYRLIESNVREMSQMTTLRDVLLQSLLTNRDARSSRSGGP